MRRSPDHPSETVGPVPRQGAGRTAALSAEPSLNGRDLGKQLPVHHGSVTMHEGHDEGPESLETERPARGGPLITGPDGTAGTWQNQHPIGAGMKQERFLHRVSFAR